MLLGAHVPARDGLYNAIFNGEELGCQSIQMFTKNPNRWKPRELTDDEVGKFAESWQNSSIDVVISHDSHLTNLASTKKDVLEMSRNSFLLEIQRCARLKIPFLGTHLGAHLGAGEEDGLALLGESLRQLLRKAKADVTILLETTAGQGTNMGYKFEHIRKVMDLIGSQYNVGVCFDTCHSFAAGYDMRTKKKYRETFDEFDVIIGLENLKAFHLNDSKYEFGSRVDRHEHIGKGKIGLEAFRLLVNDERFANVPAIIETPESETMHQVNLEILRGLIN